MNNDRVILVQHRKLKSQRLILRWVELSDAPDLFEVVSDQETTRFLFPPHDNVQQTERMIANYYMEEPQGKYAVVLKETGKVIGTFEFRVHAHNRSGEIGFTLGSRYWGHGYMTEAGKLILELAFRELKLERVYAMHDTTNPASGRLMQRLGMTLEGILRHERMDSNRWVDSAHYSILQHEYIQLDENSTS
ncbi:GNAT family N-acetyltransferase [Paenibacillus kandeliae]|uniref:GNAT family N-acetyltransferase n=1 Tax=Paenibacillus kandeliae TaxID=3231269 RepID=UPI003459CBD7